MTIVATEWSSFLRSVSTSESLKVDNTKLYEKVRYLQNYNNKNGPSGSGGSGLTSRHNQSNTRLVDRDLDLEALEQRYEASVDPFRQFNRSETFPSVSVASPLVYDGDRKSVVD